MTKNRGKISPDRVSQNNLRQINIEYPKFEEKHLKTKTNKDDRSRSLKAGGPSKTTHFDSGNKENVSPKSKNQRKPQEVLKDESLEKNLPHCSSSQSRIPYSSPADPGLSMRGCV